MLGGDPDRLRDLARALRQESGEVSGVADDVRHARGVTWESTAADLCRDALGRQAGLIDMCAEVVHDAAGSVDALADELAERQRAIRAAQRLVLGLLTQAQETVWRLADVPAHELGEAAAAARSAAETLLDTARDLPGPGSPDWLGLAHTLRGGRS